MSSAEAGQSRHFFGWICVILVMGVVFGSLWMGTHVGQRSSIAILPDGSTVEFLGTAVGQNPFTTETRWQRVAKSYLPTPIHKWIPTPVKGSCYSGSNSLTVYLRILGTNPAGSGGSPWQGYVPEDEAGFRYPRNGGFCSFSDVKGQMVYGLSLSAYPRRQREFLFHLLDQKDAVMATFRVPTPTPGPFPVWQPEPLPQTRTNGPVTLTLLRLTENPSWHYYEPKWRLESVDPAWAKAKPRNRGFRDSTGNEGQFLSRRETAWKWQTLVYRERVQDFASNEQTVLTNLTVPEAGNFVAIDQSVDCGGVFIKTWVLAGAGTFGISNGVTRFMKAQPSNGHSSSSGSFGNFEEWGSSTPFLLVEARNVQENDEVEFRIQEDTGQEVKAKASGYNGLPGGGRLYKPSFTPSEECKSVTVRIIVNRPLAFEFMVDPAETK